MVDKILLNDQLFTTGENSLPLFVEYTEGTGGSHLTMTLLSDLFSHGSKILLLTAYPMAKENFLQQIGEDTTRIGFVNTVSDFEKEKNKQAIILDSGNEELFIQAINVLQDFEERVVLVKNIEVFNDKIFETCLRFDKLILSGDVDKCPYKEKILNKRYNTIIAFCQPLVHFPITVPKLEKYVGFLYNEKFEGFIKIEKNN
jgi:hypothetical protein